MIRSYLTRSDKGSAVSSYGMRVCRKRTSHAHRRCYLRQHPTARTTCVTPWRIVKRRIGIALLDQLSLVLSESPVNQVGRSDNSQCRPPIAGAKALDALIGLVPFEYRDVTGIPESEPKTDIAIAGPARGVLPGRERRRRIPHHAGFLLHSAPTARAVCDTSSALMLSRGPGNRPPAPLRSRPPSFAVCAGLFISCSPARKKRYAVP